MQSQQHSWRVHIAANQPSPIDTTPTDRQPLVAHSNGTSFPRKFHHDQALTATLPPNTNGRVEGLRLQEVQPNEFVSSYSYDVFNSKPLNVLGTIPDGMELCETELLVYSQTYVCGTRIDGTYNCLRDILYPAAYSSPSVLQWMLIGNERHVWFAQGHKTCPPSIYRRRAQVFRMTTDLLSNRTTSNSNDAVGAVAIAVAMDFEDDYARQDVVDAHVNGLDLLLRSRGGLSAFHMTPSVYGLIIWALAVCCGGVFRTMRERETCRVEIRVMLKNLDAWNRQLVQKVKTDNQDWLTYFSARRELFDPDAPFMVLLAPKSSVSASFSLTPYTAGDQHCRLLICTVLNIALWDHRSDPVAATRYLTCLKEALSTSAFVDQKTGRWSVAIQILCAIVTFGGFEMHGRHGNGYKRECERMEQAVGVLRFASAVGNGIIDRLVAVMLGWLSVEETVGVQWGIWDNRSEQPA